MTAFVSNTAPAAAVQPTQTKFDRGLMLNRRQVQQMDPITQKFLRPHILYNPPRGTELRETLEGHPGYRYVQGWSFEREGMVGGFILKSGAPAFEKDFPATNPGDAAQAAIDRKVDQFLPRLPMSNAQAPVTLDRIAGGGEPVATATHRVPAILGARPHYARAGHGSHPKGETIRQFMNRINGRPKDAPSFYETEKKPRVRGKGHEERKPVRSEKKERVEVAQAKPTKLDTEKLANMVLPE